MSEKEQLKELEKSEEFIIVILIITEIYLLIMSTNMKIDNYKTFNNYLDYIKNTKKARICQVDFANLKFSIIFAWK